jgi:hypothetical protein
MTFWLNDLLVSKALKFWWLSVLDSAEISIHVFAP